MRRDPMPERGPAPVVLNNRWSISESMDDEYFTTRTIHGNMRVATVAVPADAYRNLIVPTLETGFKRERLDYNIAANGLDIDYIVTDKQVHTAAPWPAVKLDVRHSEGTAQGAKFESEVHVNLKGHPGASKVAMLGLASRIIEDRLGKFKNMPTDGGKLPLAFSVVDTIGERNGIEMYVKILHSVYPTTGNFVAAINYLGTPVGKLGQPLALANLPAQPGGPTTYDPVVSNTPWPWGYDSQDRRPTGWTAPSRIVNLLIGCYLQYPCNFTNRWITQVGVTTPPSPAPMPPGPTPPTPSQNNPLQGAPGGQVTNVSQNPNVPQSQRGRRPYHRLDHRRDVAYTMAAAETTLSISPLRAQLPIAADAAKWNGTDDTCVFVTLGLPQATITFHFECERVGGVAQRPQPVPSFSYQTAAARSGSACRLDRAHAGHHRRDLHEENPACFMSA